MVLRHPQHATRNPRRRPKPRRTHPPHRRLHSVRSLPLQGHFPRLPRRTTLPLVLRQNEEDPNRLNSRPHTHPQSTRPPPQTLPLIRHPSARDQLQGHVRTRIRLLKHRASRLYQNIRLRQLCRLLRNVHIHNPTLRRFQTCVVRTQCLQRHL